LKYISGIEAGLSVVDRLSILLGRAAMVLVIALTAVMVYEVVSRRIFDAPTLWAFDLSYMINGTIYLGAAGLTLLRNEHVRIDFLSTKMPLRLQHAANLAIYALLFLPALTLIGKAAIADALYAFQTDQLDRVSPWAPLIWPYFAAISAGLSCLFLQSLAQAIRHAIAAIVPGAPVGNPLRSDQTGA